MSAKAYIAMDHDWFADAPVQACSNLAGDMYLVVVLTKEVPLAHHASNFDCAAQWIYSQRLGGSVT
jgi:hypothetical protein